MTGASKAKNCPFCGSKADGLRWSDESVNVTSVRCANKNCIASFKSVELDVWNYRAGEPATTAAPLSAEQLDKLEKATQTGEYMTRAEKLALIAQARAAGQVPSVEVKVERNRVWIVNGNQSFMLAYVPDKGDDPTEMQAYADNLRAALSGFTPCANSAAQAEPKNGEDGYICPAGKAQATAPQPVGEQDELAVLASVIHAAAVKAGIIAAGAAVSGPQLVMLCDDLASTALDMRASSAPVCLMCNDSGIVGFPPDQYEECPDCIKARASSAPAECGDMACTRCVTGEGWCINEAGNPYAAPSWDHEEASEDRDRATPPSASSAPACLVHQMRHRAGGTWTECDADGATCIKRMPHWADAYEFRTLQVVVPAPTPSSAAPAAQAVEARPELTVWCGAMPESNGKRNFTATLKRKGASMFDTDSYTFSRSEYPDRVRYEADCMRYLIGELPECPDILDYDDDKHSGYAAPAAAAAPAELTASQIAAGAAVLDDDGKPVGRNVAIMVADAMRVAPGEDAKDAAQRTELDGWNAAAKALAKRAAGHYQNKNFTLQDEVLQCASMLHDLKPAPASTQHSAKAGGGK